MKLHEAIEKLLLQSKQPLTTHEIANALNKHKWYKKKDRSLIDSFQIYGRTKNYSQLFNRNGQIISLVARSKIKKPSIVNAEKRKLVLTKTNKISTHSSVTLPFLDKTLMNEKIFKSAGIIDNIVTEGQCGLYCIRIPNINRLPKPFNHLLRDRGHNIVYIGVATICLKKRFLNQELRAIGHGTFFRSIGAVLGYKPPRGSLLQKSNKRNYKFSKDDNDKIIEWINKNLIVNWMKFTGDFEGIETKLIHKYRPLINIAKNPSSLQILINLRAECVRIANSAI